MLAGLLTFLRSFLCQFQSIASGPRGPSPNAASFSFNGNPQLVQKDQTLKSVSLVVTLLSLHQQHGIIDKELNAWG